MQPFHTLTSTAVPLPLPNIDTDQIIPKQFLKRIERTGYGDFLFYDWRYELDTPDHVAERRDFVLNKPEFKGAEILIAEKNFGCGSSREHAAWAIVELLLGRVTANPAHRITIDLAAQQVTDQAGFEAGFEVDPFRKYCLLHGLDDIGLTLQHADELARFESRHDDEFWLAPKGAA